MLKQTQDGIWQSDLLLSAGVVHGYSGRRMGDMRKSKHREKFLSHLRLSPENSVLSEQIHGSKVQLVSMGDKGTEVKVADGLVYKKNNDPINLAVMVADCVPILAVDPVAGIIAAAHAGWKGTLGTICTNLIETMKAQGADSSRILVSIGPHIGMCCYGVSEERAAQFSKTFKNGQHILSQIGDVPHLDLGYANLRQLLDAGVPNGHIDSAVTCTSCQVATFYSYRKDSKETFGEMLGVVGYEY